MLASRIIAAICAAGISLAASFVGGQPADPPHGRPERTEITAPVSVPASLARGKITVEAKINGRGPFLFLVDTGAGITVLNQDLADELGLESAGTTRLGDPANPQSVTANVVRLESVDIGGAAFRGVGAVAWDRGGLYGGDNPPRGVLGYPLFASCLVTVDYPGSRLRLAPGELPVSDGKTVLDYTIDHGGIPVFDVEIAGKTVPAHIDSGAMGGLSAPPAWEQDLPLHGPSVPAGRGRTASGEYEIRAGTLSGQLRIGSYAYDDPAIRFNPALRTANIGTEILKNFAVTLDPAHRRVRFETPGAVSAPQQPAPAVGQRPRLGVKIAGQLGGHDGGALWIEEVVAGSPAEKAGLLAGDVIVKLNGRARGELDEQSLRKELTTGPVVTFEIERDGKAKTIAVQLGDAPAQPGAQPSKPEDEIRATLTSMEQALVKGANADVAACYHDDAVIIGPRGEEARGREAVNRYWSGINGAKAWTLQIVSVEGTKDVAVQRGRSDLTYTQNGNERRSVVECLHVWKRDAAGKLRIAVDVYWPAADRPGR